MDRAVPLPWDEALEGQVKDCDYAIVVGDLNVRVGSLSSRNINGKRCDYNGVKAFITNYMSRAIANICDEKAMVVVTILHMTESISEGIYHLGAVVARYWKSTCV